VAQLGICFGDTIKSIHYLIFGLHFWVRLLNTVYAQDTVVYLKLLFKINNDGQESRVYNRIIS